MGSGWGWRSWRPRRGASMSWTLRPRRRRSSAAVGESRIDLMVEDTGDPEQLAHRLAELGGMPVVHLSCHGLNNWPDRPGAPGCAGADDGRRASAGAARRRPLIW